MISILTPTFNRASYLIRLHHSLNQQQNKNFEWVIVNDGSTDNTEAVVSSFLNSSSFNTKIVNKTNGGKHTAINAGLPHCDGDWTFIVDSDDMLTNDAIEKAINAITETPPHFAGICFRKAYLNGTIIGKTITGNIVDTNPTIAGNLFNGDLAYIFKTTLLIENPFPVINNEYFFPELYIWNKIGDIGPIRYFTNSSIYLCEYLAGGLSASFKKNLRNNPKGCSLFYFDQIKREKNFQKKIKNIIRYTQCCINMFR